MLQEDITIGIGTATCGRDHSILSQTEIDGEVGGQPCVWLIDIGAEISVISQNLASMARGRRVPARYTPHYTRLTVQT
jgi:hypothetical protein